LVIIVGQVVCLGLIAAAAFASNRQGTGGGRDLQVTHPGSAPSNSAPFNQSKANQLCMQNAAGMAVKAAYVSTAGAVAAWQEHQQSQQTGTTSFVSQWRDHQESDPVAVCFVVGSKIQPSRPAPAPGTTPTTFDIMSVVVSPDGTSRAWEYGTQQTMSTAPPPSS
jgi:hypothetical protein